MRYFAFFFHVGFSKSSVYFTMTVHLNSDQPSFTCSVASAVATVLDRSGVDSELRLSPSHPFSSQQATDCLSAQRVLLVAYPFPMPADKGYPLPLQNGFSQCFPGFSYEALPRLHCPKLTESKIKITVLSSHESPLMSKKQTLPEGLYLVGPLQQPLHWANF